MNLLKNLGKSETDISKRTNDQQYVLPPLSQNTNSNNTPNTPVKMESELKQKIKLCYVKRGYQKRLDC